MSTASLVHLLSGKDPSALSRLLGEARQGLLGGEDPSLALTRFTAADYTDASSEPSPAPVVEACLTPPMFTPWRVVVARDLAMLNVKALEPLIAYLAKPADTTRLLLVWEDPAGRGASAPPSALLNAVKSAGGEHRSSDMGFGKAAAERWLKEQCGQAQVRLDNAAFGLLADRLGEDRTRIWGLLETLASTYGDARLSAHDVAPFLGEEGPVPPWGLTDAISRGDIGKSLVQLRRLSRAGERHPLQVMASLHVYFDRIVRLDGAEAESEAEAAALLRRGGALSKGGSTYPARIALSEARKLGSQRIRRIFELLAKADLNLKGGTGLPAETTLEILVARLAQIHR